MITQPKQSFAIVVCLSVILFAGSLVNTFTYIDHT